MRDPAKFKALLCGRRAGKTATAIYDFAKGVKDDPGTLNLYVALTMSSAREILWEPFKQANAKFGWGLVFDESKLIVKHANGWRLLVRGADDVRELEKLRGVAFKRVRIDECGAHRPSYLEYLVEQVLEATLMDCDGDVWLLGTCTRQAFGYFFDLTNGVKPGYSVHRWTAAANPHVNFEKFVHEPITGLLARRNWTQDNPIFRREYLAEWVIEDSAKVYRFERVRNIVRELPQLYARDQWVYVMGIDFGVGHKTAAVVLAYPKLYGRDVYAVDTWAEAGLAPSDACEKIWALRQKWGPRLLVGDVGGMGKAYQAEWNKRFPKVAIKAADKRQKRAALEFTSDALHTAISAGDYSARRGLMSLAGNDALHREWATLLWDEDREDVAEGQDDDLSHAALYAYRECPAWHNAKRPDSPPSPVANTTHEVWDNRRRGNRLSPEDRALVRGWRGK